MIDLGYIYQLTKMAAEKRLPKHEALRMIRDRINAVLGDSAKKQ